MAANRPHVPKFGNWEAANNTPYTVVFDKARKGRTDGRMINPNDPQENPDMFPNYGPPPQAPPPRNRNEPEERVGAGRGVAQPPQGGRGANSGRTARPGAGSIGQSPLHPQQQPKLGGRGNASPALGGKNSYDMSQGTPGRTSGRPGGRGDETPNKGNVLPKFGEWDETNPASADNYTQVFDKARADKNDDGKSAPVPLGPSSHAARRQKYEDDMNTVKCCCCFSWRK